MNFSLYNYYRYLNSVSVLPLAAQAETAAAAQLCRQLCHQDAARRAPFQQIITRDSEARPGLLQRSKGDVGLFIYC